MNPDTVATGLLVAAVLAYFAAGLLAVLKKEFASLALFAFGWILNAATVGFNWLACGHPPFGSMYHVLVAVSLCFLPAYLYMRRFRGMPWLCASFAFTSVVPLMGPLFMDRNLFWRRMPALQSYWFVPHVVAYLIAYALAAVAFVLALRFLRKSSSFRPELIRGVDEITRLAFPFMTFGLFSGALWAEGAWGRFWSWDAKETWALIMWLSYTLYLHCRRSGKYQRFAMTWQFIGFGALVITFLFVSLFPRMGSVLHTYAQ